MCCSPKTVMLLGPFGVLWQCLLSFLPACPAGRVQGSSCHHTLCTEYQQHQQKHLQQQQSTRYVQQLQQQLVESQESLATAHAVVATLQQQLRVAEAFGEQHMDQAAGLEQQLQQQQKKR